MISSIEIIFVRVKLRGSCTKLVYFTEKSRLLQWFFFHGHYFIARITKAATGSSQRKSDHGLHTGVRHTARQGNVLRGRDTGRPRGPGHDRKLQIEK